MSASVRHNAADQRSLPPLRVVMAGGGTGGHLFPAIALAQELQRREPRAAVLFVSTGQPIERTTLARYGFELAEIPAEGLKGKSLKIRVRAVVKAFAGVVAALKIVNRFRPDLMVSVGSYAAGPVGLAGWLARVPLVLQEQNSVPGVTHRMLQPMVRRVYTSFRVSRRWFPADKVRLLGNPLRRELFQEQADGMRSPGRQKSFTVLILGGSQGAHAINRAVAEALGLDLPKMGWIHQTGAADEEWVREAYAARKIAADIRGFFTNMAQVYQRADLVICRAGASTVTELTALGKPAILIPFPHAADDHQTHNARDLSDQGAAEILMESDLNGKILATRIRYFQRNPQHLARMGRRAAALGRRHAARDIVDDWYQMLNRPQKTPLPLA